MTVKMIEINATTNTNSDNINDGAVVTNSVFNFFKKILFGKEF